MFRAEDKNKLQAGIDFFRDPATGQPQKNPSYFLEHPFVYEQDYLLRLFTGQPEGQENTQLNGTVLYKSNMDSAVLFGDVFLIAAEEAIGQNPHLFSQDVQGQIREGCRYVKEQSEEYARLLADKRRQKLIALQDQQRRGWDQLQIEEKQGKSQWAWGPWVAREILKMQEPPEKTRLEKAQQVLKNIRSNDDVVELPRWQIEKLAAFGTPVHQTIMQNLALFRQAYLEMQQVIAGAADIFDEIERLYVFFQGSGKLSEKEIENFKIHFGIVFKDLARNYDFHLQSIETKYHDVNYRHEMYYFLPQELSNLHGMRMVRDGNAGGEDQGGIPYHIEYYLSRDVNVAYRPRKDFPRKIDESMKYLTGLFQRTYQFSRDNNLFVEWVKGEGRQGVGYCLDARSDTLETQQAALYGIMQQRIGSKKVWADMGAAISELQKMYLAAVNMRLIQEDRQPERIDLLPEALGTLYPMLEFIVKNFNGHKLQDGAVITKEAVIRYCQEVLFDEYDPALEQGAIQAAILEYANQRFKAHYFDRIPQADARRAAIDAAIQNVDGLVIDSPEEKAEYLRLLEGARPMLQNHQLVGARLEECLRALPLPECLLINNEPQNPLTFRQHPFVPYSPDGIDSIFQQDVARHLEPETRAPVGRQDVVPAFCAQNVFLVAARNAISNNRAGFNQDHIRRVEDAIANLAPCTIACAEHYLEQFCVGGEELYNRLATENGNVGQEVVLEQVPAARARIFHDVARGNPPSMAKLAQLLDRNDPTIRRLAGPGLQPVAPAARPAVQPAPVQNLAAPQQPEVEALRVALVALGINVQHNAGVEALIQLGQARVLDVEAGRVQLNNNDVQNEEEMQLQLGIVQAMIEEERQNALDNAWRAAGPLLFGPGPQVQRQNQVQPPAQPAPNLLQQAANRLFQQQQGAAARLQAEDRERQERERQRLADAQAAAARADAERQRVERERQQREAAGRQRLADVERQRVAAAAAAQAEAERQRALLEQQQRAAAQVQFDAMFRAGDYPNVDNAQKRERVIAAQGAPAVVPGFQQNHFLGLVAEELRQVDARIAVALQPVPPQADAGRAARNRR